jgi:hypothetical protein
MNAKPNYMIGERRRSAAPQEALAARRGWRQPGGGVVIGRGRAFALAAVLAVMACGGLAARADAFVYWSNNVALGRASLDGAGVNQNLLGVGLGVYGVAVDGQHVYWTDYNAAAGGAIGRANRDGSAVDPGFITGLGLSLGVAVDGQHVYWTDYNSIVNSGTMGRANLDGSGVDDNFVVDADFPKGVAVDALPLAPLASIATPAAGATYTVGQAVDSSLGCSDGAGGPGITSCVDRSGRPAGAAIDTSSVGSHAFTVTATSGDGQTQSASSTYTVMPAPAPPPASGPGRSPGRLPSDLRASHSRWREGRALPHITSGTNHTPRQRSVGTTFSFTLNQPATVKLAFTRQASSRVVSVKGHRECVAETKHNQRRLRCDRTVTVAGLSLKAPSGADKIGFAGRVSPTRKLSLGSYTTTITATSAGGESSAPKSLRFTIVK